MHENMFMGINIDREIAINHGKCIVDINFETLTLGAYSYPRFESDINQTKDITVSVKSTRDGSF